MSGTREGALKTLAIRLARGDIGTIGLAELRRRSQPGECICCGEPAKPKSSSSLAVRRRRAAGRRDWFDTCSAPECRAVWFRYWRRDAVAALRANAAALRRLEAA